MATITRPQAASVLNAKLSRLAAEVKQTAIDDSPAGYGIDLDDALRRMQKEAEALLTTTVEVAAYLVIARYYALVRFASLLATRVDTQSFSVEGDREQIFTNVLALIKQAVEEAAVYGYVLQTRDDGQIGSGNTPPDQSGSQAAYERTFWPTDFLTPAPPGYPPVLI